MRAGTRLRRKTRPAATFARNHMLLAHSVPARALSQVRPRSVGMSPEDRRVLGDLTALPGLHLQPAGRLPQDRRSHGPFHQGRIGRVKAVLHIADARQAHLHDGIAGAEIGLGLGGPAIPAEFAVQPLRRLPDGLLRLPFADAVRKVVGDDLESQKALPVRLAAVKESPG